MVISVFAMFSLFYDLPLMLHITQESNPLFRSSLITNRTPNMMHLRQQHKGYRAREWQSYWLE
jgi:hypothetical protein